MCASLLFANDRPGRYPPSWYAASATPLPEKPRLEGERRADVCVIGGGYTGLSAALHLAEAGHDVVLLEAHRVGWGASGRNGGQVASGQRVDPVTLEARYGAEIARMLWDLGEEAKGLVRRLVTRHAPEADWRGGILDACWHEADVAHAHAIAEKVERDYGYKHIQPLDRTALRRILDAPAYQGGFLDRGAGHIHPLRYAFGLARAAEAAGATIHERTLVHHVEGHGTHGSHAIVRTERGRVIADHVVLAANGYLGNLDRKVAARVMPINNFIIATEPLGPRARRIFRKDVAVADSRFVINYFRLSEDGRLLFGGGESYGYRFPKDIAAVVRKPMLEVFPELADVAIDYAWGGTLAITRPRLPLFLRPRPGVWNASGYSGHGISIATFAGKAVAEAIRGTSEKFDAMAAIPVPPFPGGTLMRTPLLILAMSWFALRDRLGI